MRRLLAVLGLSAAGVLAVAAPAAAHPLGNFTVNTADSVTVVAGGVEVLHVVDLAEIPSVQLRGPWDADDDGRLSPAELQRYADATCAQDVPLLALEVDGAVAPLALDGARAAQADGQAGLPTTRVECDLRASVAPQEQVEFSDGSSAGRTGWREVVATTRCGSVTSSDVPAESPSALLTAYPEDQLAAPVDVRTASFTVDPGPCSAGGGGSAAAPAGLGGLASAVTDFLGRPALTVPFAALSVLVALVFGAVHALAPGHGKTVLAAYLVGQRGTRRQALQLGAVVTFTHTASVLVLGAVLALGTLAAPERVVPLTEVVSGVLLALVGAYLLVLAVRRRRAHGHDHHDHDHGHEHDHDHGHGHDHDHGHGHGHGNDDHGHGHDDHGHDHPHPHPHVPVHQQPVPAGGGLAVATRPAPVVHSHGGRAHSHEIPEGPLTWRSLAAMGVAGGLVPSPSALVVLLGATYLGRAWFGVLLVVVYGLGMAATLTVAGLLLLRAQAALDRRGWALGRAGRWGRLLPLLTALVVVALGLWVLARGVLTATSLG